MGDDRIDYQLYVLNSGLCKVQSRWDGGNEAISELCVVYEVEYIQIITTCAHCRVLFLPGPEEETVLYLSL